MLPVAKLKLLRGEAPALSLPPVTHPELKGQRSDPFVASVKKKKEKEK